MAGDFSRFTFDPNRDFSGLHVQRGGASDADWNEALDIARHRDWLTRLDALGPFGLPSGAVAFAPKLSDGILQIGAGTCYVGGLRCVNPVDTTIGDRLVEEPGDQPAGDGRVVLVLEAWERSLEAVDVPDLGERLQQGTSFPPAVRSAVTWRLRRVAAGDVLDSAASPNRLVAWFTKTPWIEGGQRDVRPVFPWEQPPGTLAARPIASITEDALHRIEVHRSAAPGGRPTLKWSLNNGTTTSTLATDGMSGSVLTLTVTVDDFPPGHRITRNKWIELTDSRRRRLGLPGPLARIVDANDYKVAVEWLDPEPDLSSWEGPVLIRQWDLVEDLEAADYTMGQWRTLTTEGTDDTIEIRLKAGRFTAGDVWLIAARAARNALLWPEDGIGPADRMPYGPRRYYAPWTLSTVTGETWSEVLDHAAAGPVHSLWSVNRWLERHFGALENPDGSGGLSSNELAVERRLRALDVLIPSAGVDESNGIRFPALRVDRSDKAYLQYAILDSTSQGGELEIGVGEGAADRLVLRAGPQSALSRLALGNGVNELTGSLSVTGPVSLDAGLQVSKEVVLNSTLSVSDTSTLSGNVGINGLPSASPLRVHSSPKKWQKNGWLDGIHLDLYGTIGWEKYPGKNSFGMGVTKGVFCIFTSSKNPGETESSSTYALQVDNNANLIAVQGLTVNKGLTIKGTVNGAGTIQSPTIKATQTFSYRGAPPFKYREFTNVAGGYDTGESVTDWHAAIIVGFNSSSGDIDESGKGIIMRMFTEKSNGKWSITATFNTGTSGFHWTVRVLFIRAGLVS